MNKTPDHLGGHLNRTNTDEPLLRYVKERFDIESMLDIGCGPGGMKEVANNMGINWWPMDNQSVVFKFEYQNEDGGGASSGSHDGIKFGLGFQF